MEAKIYFTIKLVCAVFIFRQLWIFIFNREMYGIWEKAYRLMRIVRINLWKYRKKRSEQKARVGSQRSAVATQDSQPGFGRAALLKIPCKGYYILEKQMNIFSTIVKFIFENERIKQIHLAF